MGVLETIFKRPKAKKIIDSYFALLDGYTPVFTTYDGGVYEMELTRACIDAGARHASKLCPNIEGADLRGLLSTLNNKPNPFMTTSNFLYRTFTMLQVSNTCYIVPILNQYDETIGFYPVSPAMTEVLDVSGEPFLRYTFTNGQKASIEFSRVGMVTRFQHKNDFRGEDNRALASTISLIDMQDQGIEEGIKNGASFRFIANASNFAKPDDLAKERKRFTADNFTGEGSGGVLLFPNTYTNVKQVISQPKVVDSEQMKIIQTRVFNYFGCNESVLQNKLSGDDWSAFYEGAIEPFAIQLGEAMTAMTYTGRELARGNKIVWSSSRLQNMTNADKLQYSTQMFDRGLATLNDIADVWNRPHVPDGDKRYIRREYMEITAAGEINNTETEGTTNADTGQQAVQGNDNNADSDTAGSGAPAAD